MYVMIKAEDFIVKEKRIVLPSWLIQRPHAFCMLKLFFLH
jgi:hypothetical protein